MIVRFKYVVFKTKMLPALSIALELKQLAGLMLLKTIREKRGLNLSQKNVKKRQYRGETNPHLAN
jgi:hypothetical protein